jgi:hypothetical protein
MSLQELFLQSGGRPIQVDNWTVGQSALIPVRDGSVTIRLLSGKRRGHGIRLKARDGSIELSDGSRVKVVDTWFDASLPDEITYQVRADDGHIRMWNVYQTVHPNGEITQDMWTGDAGMVLLSESSNKRTYGCSPGNSAFNPRSLVIEVEWIERHFDQTAERISPADR